MRAWPHEYGPWGVGRVAGRRLLKLRRDGGGGGGGGPPGCHCAFRNFPVPGPLRQPTPSSQRTISPLQVMMMLHELFSRYDAMLDQHHVYKVETIGGGSPGGPGRAERRRAAAGGVLPYPTEDRTSVANLASIAHTHSTTQDKVETQYPLLPLQTQRQHPCTVPVGERNLLRTAVSAVWGTDTPCQGFYGRKHASTQTPRTPRLLHGRHGAAG